MRILIILFFLFTSVSLPAQEKLSHLAYGKVAIAVPGECFANSEFEILDCQGFSAQWLYLSEEMVEQGVHDQFAKQITTQLDFTKKKTIKFTSQGELFKGNIYSLANGKTRIIAFGRVTNIPLILNLGFDKEPKNNADLSDFEKNFIVLKQ